MDFDWKTYIENYEDLRMAKINTKEKALIHWTKYGKKENRTYEKINHYKNDVFDWVTYTENYVDLRNAGINTKEKAWQHWNLYGKKEGRTYTKQILKTNNENVITFNDKSDVYKISDYTNFINEQIDINLDNNNNHDNIIISLTAIPPRFISDQFLINIDKLYNQQLKAKYIVINLCDTYRREFEYNKEDFTKRINILSVKYPNIIINICKNDYGPITKILGILDVKKLIINPEDIIISLDDDWEYSDNMTFYYKYCYQLYNCDAVFVDERYNIIWDSSYENYIKLQKQKDIFYDNYKNFVYGWLSFSFKYKCLEKLKYFYKKICEEFPNICKHDDLIITIFYKYYKIYSCGMSILFCNLNNKLLSEISALKNMQNEWTNRYELEKQVLKKYDYKYSILNGHNYIINDTIFDSTINIIKKIYPRTLLYNINELSYNPAENDFYFKHIDLKYLNEKTFLLTVTYFSNIIINDIVNIKYKGNNVHIILPTNNFSKKQSFVILLKNMNITKINHLNYKFNIIQTYISTSLSHNKLLSICTILNYLPDISYKFFDNNDIINYIQKLGDNYLNLYNKLDVGAYKADMFRALYLYFDGGLYFDCKMILFSSIRHLFNNNYFFVKDILVDYVYNGLMFNIQKKNFILKSYIINMLTNIFKNSYEIDPLSITGPGLLGKYAKNNVLLYNSCVNNDTQNSFISEKKILVKNTYFNYYNENNYLATNHYHIKWHNKTVYNLTKIPYQKINFIDHIVWINLDRCEERRNNMIANLSNINVPNTRINAVDGKTENLTKYELDAKLYKKKLSPYEIACTLSHIKAINFLSNTLGNYFLVLEDDVSFDNLILFNNDINNIINKSEKFDIMLLHKIYQTKLESEYTSWNNEFSKGHDGHIASTAAYIITKEGINKIIEKNKYDTNTNIFLIDDANLDVADKYIYNNLNTLVYKYNFISALAESSMIHNEDIAIHRNSEKYQLNIIFKDIIL
jgi:GR25 family glycosyltransferase involved in LPS biosynthesis